MERKCAQLSHIGRDGNSDENKATVSWLGGLLDHFFDQIIFFRRFRQGSITWGCVCINWNDHFYHFYNAILNRSVNVEKQYKANDESFLL